VTVDVVAVAEEIGGHGVVWESLDDLLSRPGGSGMFGDIEMQDAATVVAKHDQDEEHPQASSGNGEEVERDEIADMVGEERSPGLRRLYAALLEQPRDGALGNVDPQLEKFAVDSRRAPQGIGRGDPCDQGTDFGVDGRPPPGGPGREPGPVLTEAAPLPAQHGVGGNDQKRLPPSGPDAGQGGPEEPISCAELRPAHRSLVHGELLTQGEVLQSDLTVTTAEDRQESQQVEQEGDHRAEIVAGSAPTNQSFGAGRSFGEGQAGLARVSSSRVALHRRLRVLGRGAAGAFPP
jgi:hypothetical protein